MTTPTTSGGKKAATPRRQRGALASALASAPVTPARAHDTPPEPPTETAPQPAPEAAPAPPQPAPEAPQAAPEGPPTPPEGHQTGEAVSAPEAPPQPVVSGKPEPAAEAPQPEPAPEPAPEQAASAQTDLIVAPPQPQIPFNRIFRQQAATLPAHMQAMFTSEITRKLKSLRNIAKMLQDGQQAYEDVVHEARKAGYPDAELEKLAVQWDWDVPAPRSTP